MLQLDLFAHAPAADGRQNSHEILQISDASHVDRIVGPQSKSALDEDLDLPGVLERIADLSARPRYTFMVLNLIARAAGQSDSAGPHIFQDNQAIPIRDWLSNALLPMAQRDARRLAIVGQVRADLEDRNELPGDLRLADEAVAKEVRRRLLHSGRTNVSRAVSDLVRAGLMRRHYQGYRVDHDNRGAQREAVYTINPAVRRALGKAE